MPLERWCCHQLINGFFHMHSAHAAKCLHMRHIGAHVISCPVCCKCCVFKGIQQETHALSHVLRVVASKSFIMCRLYRGTLKVRKAPGKSLRNPFIYTNG